MGLGVAVVAGVTMVMEVLGAGGGITKTLGPVSTSIVLDCDVIGPGDISVRTVSFSVETVGFSVGTVGFFVKKVDISVGILCIFVGTVGFSVGMMAISLETVGFSVGAIGFSAETTVSEWPVGGTGDLELSTVGIGPAKKSPWGLVRIIPPPSSRTSNSNGWDQRGKLFTPFPPLPTHPQSMSTQ